MTPKNQKSNTIYGIVTNTEGQPLSNLKVIIYDVDMRQWQLLAETITDRAGKYSLNWSHAQLEGRGKKTADIAVKVLTKEKNTELYKSSMDQVRFNAGQREEINIEIEKAIPREEVEFKVLLKDVKFLAGNVAIAELEENEEHRDITFLSNELETEGEKIEHLVVAHRLHELSKADANFFYALLRKDILLHSDVSKKLSSRLSIGLQTEIKPLLFDIALLDEEDIKKVVITGISENLISSSARKKLSSNLKKLAAYREEAESYYQKEHPQRVIETLTTVFRQENLDKVRQAFEENKNDLNSFFLKISDPTFFDTKEDEWTSQTDIALGKLLGFGNAVLPNLIKDHNIKSQKDIKKLARLNKVAWVKEISKANPKVKDKGTIDKIASAIVRKMEKEYPTQAFAAQLERDKNKVLNNQNEIVSFFSKHEDFDLLKHNVDLFIKEKKVKTSVREAISGELKSVQRVFKLIPHYSKVNALRKEKIHSAQNIVAIGQHRFVNEIAPKAGLKEKEAVEVFKKAEVKHTAAMLMAGNLFDSIQSNELAALHNPAMAKKLTAVSDDFPNLKSLFKLVDTCECKHCRSVYSPAAYLVEILQFLDKRTVLSGNAKSVLFNRRPDLGDIDLSCANANTPVKYIDLVCELLEHEIAPDPGIDFVGNLSDGGDPQTGKISNSLLTTLQTAGLPVTADALIHTTETNLISPATLPHYLRDTKVVCKIEPTGVSEYKVFRLRQTLSSAEELDAAPEYVNTDAYSELNSKHFAFGLPFDLNHTEAKAYFNRFDVGRATLMSSFQVSGNPTDASIAAEQLGLADAERSIINAAPVPNDNTAQQSFWNVPAPGDTVDHLKQVDRFLDKTGLSYKELDKLLKLDFIDPNGNVFIKHKDLTCNTAEKEITNLDLDVLDRIHRFLRLQKKTGWHFEELDAIISQPSLGNGQLDDNCLLKAARIKQISERTKISRKDLTGCYGSIPYRTLSEEDDLSLYHSVFLNKAKNGSIHEDFLPDAVDGSRLLTSYLDYLATCLQLKKENVEVLLPLLVDDKLNFSNLSYLFLSTRLIKNLKLEAEDFAVLIELSGINIAQSPANTLAFIEIVDSFNYSSLKAADVKFMLTHEAADLANREIKDEKIEELLEKIKMEFAAIREENQSAFDDNLSALEQNETFINVLSGLENLGEEDVKTIVKFLDRDWVSVATAKQFIDDHFNENIVRTDINNAFDALAAVPGGGNISVEQKDLLKAILDAIADFNIRQNKRLFLRQVLSTSFKVEEDLTDGILTYTLLKQPAPGTASIAGLLLDDLSNPISEANYPQQYKVIRLLHKLLPFVEALELSNLELEWLFEHNTSLGWLELDAIPYEAGQVAIAFDTYLALLKTLETARRYSPVANPLDPEQPISFFTVMEMVLPGSLATRSEWLQALSFLTAYSNDDLDDLDAYFFPVFAAANYHDIYNWDLLLTGAEYLRKLTVTLDQVKEYIKPVLTAVEVMDLRATLKARYDEDTWLSTLKEIMDSIRPQKRDALISYLLATNPGIKDENDLYEYLLVDVNMEACMPSSRIVQAHNSIQLFVQRCLMGLEPAAIANIGSDPNWHQWKWMKNYRVWEANRKVFLYPENWYDVTLTDDKTFLLSELIEEIQQNELTNTTAETALKRYLEKLDNIAFLEVMASWYDVPTRDMHVFARTKGGDPAIYYYRRFENERYWTPWEKVELDISGDHLLAFMRNNRLHLAWPIFSEIVQSDQQSTIPNSTAGTVVTNDKPKKKVKVQLAISEYTDKTWRQKRVSKEAIYTPSYFTDQESLLDNTDKNLIYFEGADQILLFRSTGNQKGNDYQEIIGIFDIAGCKGYPEPVWEGNTGFPDFFPDFKETRLHSQRYNELVRFNPNDLSVRTGLSIFWFYEILNQTPGNYRITYPHQFTIIDTIAFIYQLFMLAIYSSFGKFDRRFKFKIPLGTLLPYFDEDSDHAYVIIPGFYKRISRDNPDVSYPLNDSEKRTASDVFQLIDDITNWVKKITLEFQDDPPADADEAIQRIIADSDFQDILMEMAKYQFLDVILNLLVGKMDNDEFDVLVRAQGLQYGEQFKNLYHPLVCELRSILYKEGIPTFMNRETQLLQTDFDFESHYGPNKQIVPTSFYKNPDGTLTESYPIEDLDFNSDGSYSAYNWDLFYRVPLHIASSLTMNQRFEEAMTWLHYMFNPTGALPGNGVQKYWVTKPFYLNQGSDYISQRIDSLMYAVSDSSSPDIKELEFAISEWRNKPFRPDAVARFRPVAYQKAVLMKYIDNLTEWGDNLFRQDTMESIAQATQMYVLADKLLGPKPRIVPSVTEMPYETYNQIEAKLDSFGNALIELENILPDLSVLPEGGAELPAPPITLSMLYFCIPPNEKMMEYWNRIEDRLFKIRNCRNIDGVERSLALFAPPIDPGMLVRAAAAGLDLSSVIAGLNAPTPYYRFRIVSQQAMLLAQEVRGLGISLLQALEKKDAEELFLLRNELEIKLLTATKDMKALQIEEAEEQIEVLKKAKDTIEQKIHYYSGIEKIISKEQLHLDKLEESHAYQMASQIIQATAAVMALIPDFAIGASGFGGSPHAAAKWGGTFLAHSATAASSVLNVLSTAASYEANRASILAGYDRRFDDWTFQADISSNELVQIEQQIVAAELRKEMAETDLQNHELQIENSQKVFEFMQSKFTNKDLYNWMIGQISSVYFSSYKLAHDTAKKAERSYRFELGNDDSFISFGYWDSLKKGLQSADHLIYDIKRMQTSYLEKNKREYEITKNVSLLQLDPLALVRLRTTSVCNIEIPEAIYDMDHPGHYFRRLKTISVSILCIAGPNTSISAKLSLVSNKYRKNTNADNLAGTGYMEDPGNDERFNYNIGAIQSIATSHAQKDNGLFELDFSDDRYLPFEGTGAISSWQLELPNEVKQYNYDTISDVIIHVKYTAREGGSNLKSLANAALRGQLNLISQGLEQEGLHVAINMRHDMSNEWLLLKQNGTINLTLDTSRLPYMAQAAGASPAIESVMFIAKIADNPANFTVNIDAVVTNLARIDAWQMCYGINTDIELDTPFTLSIANADQARLEELMLVVKYSF